jgi:hypothetical protein
LVARVVEAWQAKNHPDYLHIQPLDGPLQGADWRVLFSSASNSSQPSATSPWMRKTNVDAHHADWAYFPWAWPQNHKQQDMDYNTCKGCYGMNILGIFVGDEVPERWETEVL